MTHTNDLVGGLRAGGAPRMWRRVVLESLPAIRQAVPPGSRVLEVGYGDGKLSCFMARELGWTMTGLDIRAEAAESARAAAQASGLSDRVEFLVVRPEATREYVGRFDAVFVKTVFYSSSSTTEYGEWLDWVCSVLRPGGWLVNFDTGRANALMQLYRRLRRREYTDSCLYTSEIEWLYDERFEPAFRRYYGGLSQLLAPLPGVFEAAAMVESALMPPAADSCFIVSMVAQVRARSVTEAGS